MKLNAPPATSEAPEQPVAGTAPPVEAMEPVNPTPSPPVVATWPAWFGIVDALLALMAVALAFLLASFAARNSDLWLHLATGRLLAQGQYSFGNDPFSYTTVGRYWVNHSWLFDFLAYQVFNAFGGAVLVVMKAVGIAIAAVALLAIRRPGYAWWPWVGCVTLAVIAAAPKMVMGPFAVSVVFLAVLMFLLFRVPAPAGSYQLPLLVGVLFAAWANLDAWFFVGPLAVALLLLGTLIQQKLAKPAVSDATDPLGQPPAVSTLAITLAVGFVACMINPHHVRIWQLPLEVVGTSAFVDEPSLKRIVLLTPLDKAYLDSAANGWNENGLAYAILLVGGGIALGFGAGRLRLGLLSLWIGFAILSLLTVFAIPLFAVVAVPLIAAELNALSSKLSSGKWKFASSVGRFASLFVMLLLLVCAWPGWLHPRTDFKSDTPRVAWAVVADPSLQKAAEQIEAWRTSGTIPEDTHGLILAMDLANYCAWFAPHEKVFVNRRLELHEPELKDYSLARVNVGTRADPNSPPNISAIRDLFRRHGIGYLALYERGRSWTPRTAVRILADDSHWTTWYLDGRTGVFGWRPSFAEASPAFRTLQLDVEKLAFGPNVAPVPPGSIFHAPRPSSWADDFLLPHTPAPDSADEAIAWMDLRQFLQEMNFNRVYSQQQLMVGAGGAGTLAAIGPYSAINAANWRRDQGDHYGLPLLAFRAARRAIAANPEHPDSYFALLRCLTDPDLPLNEFIRQTSIRIAMQDCLESLPPPRDYKPGGLTFLPSVVAQQLSKAFVQATRTPLDGGAAAVSGMQRIGCLTFALQAIELAIQYAEVELAASSSPKPELQNAIQAMTNERKNLEGVLIRENAAYEDLKSQKAPLAKLFTTARNSGLTDVALQLLKDADFKKEFGNEWPLVSLQQVMMELYIGRLADADQHLTILLEATKKGEIKPQLAEFLRPRVQRLVVIKFELEGDYAAAGKLLDNEQVPSVDCFPGVVAPYIPLGQLNWLMPVFQVGPLFGSAAASLEGLARFAFVGEVIQTTRQQNAEFFWQRGVLALLEGNNAAARNAFQHADRPIPNGWFLPPTQPIVKARTYLQLIDSAMKK